VYARPCGWALDKKTGSSWSVAFTPVCPGIGVPPKSYAPGVPYVVAFSVSGAYAPNTFPPDSPSPRRQASPASAWSSTPGRITRLADFPLWKIR
jgi:hypothetical protein